MIDRIENAVATIMVASVIVAPITITFYMLDYFFKLINLL